MPRWWLPFILSCCLLGSIVLADTEIRNIHFPLSTSSIVQPSGPVLDFTSGTRDFNVSSAAPELWLGWYPEKPYTSWTARVSWPASSPTKFGLDVPASLSGYPILIHITSSQLSPRFPRYPFLESATDNGAGVKVTEGDYSTPFTITLEPLLFGVLPQTAVPALGYILLFGLGAAGTVPFIRGRIENVYANVEPNSKAD